MTDIKPITDENDLRREAAVTEAMHAHPTATPPPIPIVLGQPDQGFGNGSVISNPDIEPSPTANTNVNYPGFTRVEKHEPSSPVAIQDESKPFSYRVPAFSYVLVWMFLIAAALTGAVVQQIMSLQSDAAAYASKYASAYHSAYTAPSINYFNIYFPLAITIAYCIAMVLILLSARRVSRYLGLVLSASALGYEIYELIKFLEPIFKTASKYGESTGTILNSYLSMYMAYIPFVLLPLAAAIYLLTPKAIKAYT
jgi:hypothetical protein